MKQIKMKKNPTGTLGGLKEILYIRPLEGCNHRPFNLSMIISSGTARFIAKVILTFEERSAACFTVRGNPTK